MNNTNRLIRQILRLRRKIWSGRNRVLEYACNRSYIFSQCLKSPQNLRKSLISTLPVTAIFHVFIVLFGAPITRYVAPSRRSVQPQTETRSYHLQTFLLALLLSLLTYFPTSYVLGSPSIAMFKDGHADVVLRFTWVRIFAEFKRVQVILSSLTLTNPGLDHEQTLSEPSCIPLLAL